MFGIGPIELLVVGVLCCGGTVTAGATIGLIIFLNKRNSQQNSPIEGPEGFAENLPPPSDSTPDKV